MAQMNMVSTILDEPMELERTLHPSAMPARSLNSSKSLSPTSLLLHEEHSTESYHHQPAQSPPSSLTSNNATGMPSSLAIYEQVMRPLHKSPLESVLERQSQLTKAACLSETMDLSSDPENLRFDYPLNEEPVQVKTKPKKSPALYRDQDRFIPINNIGRTMRNSIPKTGKVSKDAKECMQECVSEFISFLTSEASDRCIDEKRKTITGDDILFALSTLGFDSYVDPLQKYLKKYRDFLRLDKSDKEDSTGAVRSLSEQERSQLLLNLPTDCMPPPSCHPQL